MFPSPFRSLENYYHKQQTREHRKAVQDFAEGDVEGYHKHEHRAHRAARHASSLRTMSGSSMDKENRTNAYYNGTLNSVGGYAISPLQPMAPQQPNMYTATVPQLQVIPLAPIIIDEIQSAPSMTSLTSSPFGQNVLLGGPMDFPAATSFSSDQGCGLPPMTYSRSFDAPLDGAASAFAASAALQELSTQLIDRETRLYAMEQQRSFDQTELQQLRLQVEQMKTKLAAESSNANNNNQQLGAANTREPLSPFSGVSSSDSEDDGLGEHDGSIRRPMNFNTHVFPLVDEGVYPYPKSSSMDLSESIGPIGVPDGQFDSIFAQNVPSVRNLPPRVPTCEIPFVPSVELPTGLAWPYGFQPPVMVESVAPNAQIVGGHARQFTINSQVDPQYLISPNGAVFDGLEVNSRDAVAEPVSGGPYQRLLLSKHDESHNVGEGKGVVGGSVGVRQVIETSSSNPTDANPFEPPPIEISRAESEQYEGDGRHHHHHHHTHEHRHVARQHHLKHLEQRQGEGHGHGHHHHHHESESAPHHHHHHHTHHDHHTQPSSNDEQPRVEPVRGAAQEVQQVGVTKPSPSSGIRPKASRPPALPRTRAENAKAGTPKVEKKGESTAESEIQHYKTTATKTPHNTITTSASGASAPLRTL